MQFSNIATSLALLSILTLTVAAPAAGPNLLQAAKQPVTVAALAPVTNLMSSNIGVINIACNHLYQCIGTGIGNLASFITDPPPMSGSITLSGDCTKGVCTGYHNATGSANTILPLNIDCGANSALCMASYYGNLSDIITNPQLVGTFPSIPRYSLFLFVF
ncbi:hypothetical protein PVAG01_00244 [Phlyctema vagabunda]|uniref:Uncharacterized protein n=1 Tax=Phlyctema vagabunda TaxID=108571 RepID=A0ABR4PTQ6_9HELO